MSGEEKKMREFRCTACHKLLAREYIFDGRLEIKCECKQLNHMVCTRGTPADNPVIRKEVRNE